MADPRNIAYAGREKQGVAVTNAPALNSVVAAGANPTKAEYDTLRADAEAIRTKLNAALTALRNAGLIAT